MLYTSWGRAWPSAKIIVIVVVIDEHILWKLDCGPSQSMFEVQSIKAVTFNSKLETKTQFS